jgi:hypothetical protein
MPGEAAHDIVDPGLCLRYGNAEILKSWHDRHSSCLAFSAIGGVAYLREIKSCHLLYCFPSAVFAAGWRRSVYGHGICRADWGEGAVGALSP